MSQGLTSPRRFRGFGLLEMLVALAIAAITASMLVRAAGIGGDRVALKREAGNVMAELAAARRRALEEGRAMWVVVEPRRRLVGEYAVEEVELAWQVGPAGLNAAGRAAVGFAPDGGSTGGTIRLSHGRHVQVVQVDWLTGRIWLERADAAPS